MEYVHVTGEERIKKIRSVENEWSTDPNPVDKHDENGDPDNRRGWEYINGICRSAVACRLKWANDRCLLGFRTARHRTSRHVMRSGRRMRRKTVRRREKDQSGRKRVERPMDGLLPVEMVLSEVRGK